MQSEKSEHFQTCKHHFRLAILECINTRAIFVRYPVQFNKTMEISYTLSIIIN